MEPDLKYPEAAALARVSVKTIAKWGRLQLFEVRDYGHHTKRVVLHSFERFISKRTRRAR